MKTFKRGGIHPPESKLTKNTPCVEMPAPSQLRVMLSQSIGAPAKAIVKPGDTVSCGQKIAEPGGFVSVPVHSPVNGIVRKLEPTRTPQGIWQDSILIETDAANPTSTPEKRTDAEIKALSPEELISIVSDSGIVGLGGAAFPTHVKLSIPEGKKAEYVLINGAECEPYLTCDDTLMKSSSDGIIKGTLLIMKATGAPKGIIGIEENKPEAIGRMKQSIAGFPQLDVVVLKKKYPQGGEKQLIYALTGRTIPSGALPIETGCIVDNVATAYAIYDAVYNRRPLTERIVTVTGPDLARPGNYLIKNGTTLDDILEFAGGIPESTGKIIAGGPMMGRAVSALDSSATKGLSGILVMPMSESSRGSEAPCIRCSRCVSACPMGLEPYLLMLQARVRKWDEMETHGIMNCLECGCCSYICPANRPIVDMIRLGKQELRKKR